jgi:DNA-binding MarR family transcriptional regulator
VTPKATAAGGEARTTMSAAQMLIRISSKVAEVCQNEGMSPGQYRTLALLAEEPGRATALAELLAVTRPAVTQNIAVLESKGWVTRAPVPGDKRGRSIHVSRSGRSALRRVDRRVEQLIAELLPADEVDRFVDALAAAQPVLQEEADRWTSAADRVVADRT